MVSAAEESSQKTLHELIEQLPPEMQREVRGFAEFLAAKRRRRAEPMKLDWRGGAGVTPWRLALLEQPPALF